MKTESKFPKLLSIFSRLLVGVKESEKKNFQLTVNNKLLFSEFLIV